MFWEILYMLVITGKSWCVLCSSWEEMQFGTFQIGHWSADACLMGYGYFSDIKLSISIFIHGTFVEIILKEMEMVYIGEWYFFPFFTYVNSVFFINSLSCNYWNSHFSEHFMFQPNKRYYLSIVLTLNNMWDELIKYFHCNIVCCSTSVILCPVLIINMVKGKVPVLN